MGARAPRSLSSVLSRSPASPYVCKLCRQKTIYQRQLRHASTDPLPFTEKLRRKIWGTDNPPGLKDPYGGPSFLERRRMRRQEAQVDDELRMAEHELQETVEKTGSNKSELTPRGTLIDEVEGGLGNVPEYKPAETWDGLGHIGHLGDWRDIAPTPEDSFTPFTAFPSRPATSRAELLSCMHQALIETYLVGKPSERPPALTPRYYEALSRTRVRPVDGGETYAVEYDCLEDEQQIMEIWGLAPGLGAVQSPEASASETHSASVETEVAEPESLNQGFEDRSSGAEFEIRLEPEQESVGVQDAPEDGAMSSLDVGIQPLSRFYVVPDEKFSLLKPSTTPYEFQLLKRFTMLSGHHIPDPVRNARSTYRSIINRLDGDTTSSKKLAEKLANNPKLAKLPNLKISPRRETPVDKEKEVGRWKIIERELRSRGLPILGRPEPQRDRLSSLGR